MRCKVLVTIWFLTLAFGSFAFTVGRHEASEVKTKPEKQSAAEIEKLVKALASPLKATRDDAAQRLREMPGALTPLRCALAEGQDSKQHRELLENLVDQIRAAHFKRRLAALGKRKSDAPLDLVADLLLENRHHVTADEWKTTNEIVKAISDKVCQDKKTKLEFWREQPPQLVFKDIVGNKLMISKLSWRRVIADELAIDWEKVSQLSVSVMVLSQPFDARRNRSGGNIIMVSTRADVKKTQELGSVAMSFIFCDGDLECARISDSVLIATGKIIYRDFRDDPTSIVIPNARESAKLRLFSCADFGLEIIEKDASLRVIKVEAASVAEKSGFRAGDVIEGKDGKSPLLPSFLQGMRLAYAQEAEVRLTIQRGGKSMEILVSFVE